MAPDAPQPLPVALQRLIDEINAVPVPPTRYNRIYHRHNR
jgi:hypothetical protein